MKNNHFPKVNYHLPPTTYHLGFSLVEIVVALAIFIVVAAVGVTTLIFSGNSSRLSSDDLKATQYAQEGLEAVRAIHQKGWSNLTTGTKGLSSSGGSWVFSGSANTSGKFTRTITVAAANRSGGNVVASGGSSDDDTLKITSTVTWSVSASQTRTSSLSTYLTNWEKEIVAGP